MKTNKACIWILMTALMVSMLAGCGKEGGAPLETGGGRSSARSGRTGDRPDGEASTEPASDDEEALTVNRTDASLTHYPFSIEPVYDRINKGKYSMSFFHGRDVITLVDPYPPEGLARFFSELNGQAEEEAADMREKALLATEENEEAYAAVRDDYTVLRADSRVFSLSHRRDVYHVENAYFAGVRDKSFTTYNIDPETGKEIALTDVVLDTAALGTLAADLIYEKYVDGNPNPAAGALFESRQQLADDIGKILKGNWMYADQVYTWAPVYLGLRLTFFDEIASYDGLRSVLESGGGYIFPDTFEVTVPYTMAPEIFTPSFTDLPENYFARLGTETDYLVETSDGQKTLRVEVPKWQDDSTDYGATLYTGEIHMFFGDEKITFENTEISPYMNFGTDVYLVKNGEKRFLYLCQTGEYLEQSVEVYQMDGGTLRHVGTTEEGFAPDEYPPLDPAYFHTHIVSFLLDHPFAEGRVSCVRGNHLGEDGMPVPYFMAPDTPSDYRVTGEQPAFTLAVPVTAPYWDGLGVALSESGTKTFGAGTVIHMTHTDNESYILFEVEGTGEYIIAYAEQFALGRHVNSIGGIPLAKAFQNPLAAYSGAGNVEHVALEPELMEGYWWNKETEDALWLYAFRGEFELVLGTTGDTHTGTLVYNGNPDDAAWQLVDDTGYRLADLYFLEGEYLKDDYRMVITFHYASGDVTAAFYQPKG